MLISAKLSQKLRESFGDEEADEMVDWMHRIDAERGHLRELNDAGLARFESVLDRRLAEVDRRFGEMDLRFAELRAEMQAGFAMVHNEMAQLESRFERRFNEMMRWSLLFWISSLGTVVALLRFR